MDTDSNRLVPWIVVALVILAASSALNTDPVLTFLTNAINQINDLLGTSPAGR